MKKKTILFVNGHMKFGGIERSLLDVLRNLNYDEYKVDLLLFEREEDYLTDVPPEVNIIIKDLTNSYGSLFESMRNSTKSKDLLSFYARIVLLFRHNIHPYFLKLLQPLLLGIKKYDLAVAYRTGFCTEIVQYAVSAKRKATWWHHGEMNLSPEMLEEFKKSCCQFKEVVAVSKTCSDLLNENIPSIERFIEIIPNMVDEEKILSSAKEFVPNYDKEYKNFVTVCRLSPEKHVENVIFASELLISKGFTNFKWHIVGDGENLEGLINLCRARKMENIVIFEGKKKNPYPFIKNADLYINTSYVESQGLSILEAMAIGTPCIITDNFGIREYATEENSIIVNQDCTSLAQSIIDLFYNQNKYSNLISNTKLPYTYSKENVMRTINKFIEK